MAQKERTNPDHLPPVDTMKGRHGTHHRAPTLHPHFKNILGFCPLLSPKIPRKHQAEQIKINFCPFLQKICHDASSREQPGAAGEHTKRDTPPTRGAAGAFSPHNFSHQKYRKKSPWSDWKKFRKNLWENVSGKEKAPNLVERGRGAKI